MLILNLGIESELIIGQHYFSLFKLYYVTETCKIEKF